MAEFRAAWKIEKEILAQARRNLAQERRALDADRAAWDAEVAAVKRMVVRLEDRVMLDVGGTHFTTTRKTLTAVPHSMLGAMFCGRHDGRFRPDAAGRLRIGRSGTLFAPVLDFLRDYSLGNENAAARIRCLPEETLRPMKRELEYYGIEDAVFPLLPVRIKFAKFSPGPKMIKRRRGFGAVAFRNKECILVIGGGEEDATNDGTDTEVLPFNTSRFTPGPAMGSQRRHCTAVVLEDGRVVAVGGRGSEGSLLSTTEVLDPQGNTWSRGPGMAAARQSCAAVPLAEHRLFLLGGAGDEASALSTTEVIDLTSGLSTPGPALVSPRKECAAVVLYDGTVLVVGGHDGSNCLATTEILDVTRGTSAPGPRMNSKRRGCAAILLPEGGGVLVMGGSDDVTELATTEVLAVHRNATSPGPDMCSKRGGCAAVRKGNDCILVMGGSDGNGEQLCTSEVLYMPTRGDLRKKRRRLR